MAKYNISFSGKILPGQDLPVVKRRFAKAFRIDDIDRVDAFFKGFEIILRRNLDRQQAKNIQRDLLRLGIVSELQEIEEPPEKPRPTASPAQSANSGAADAPAPPAGTTKRAAGTSSAPAAKARPRGPSPSSQPSREPASKTSSKTAGVSAVTITAIPAAPKKQPARTRTGKTPGQTAAKAAASPSPAPPAAKPEAPPGQSGHSQRAQRNSTGDDRSRDSKPARSRPPAPLAQEAPKTRRRRQPGAPNFFDLRLSDRAGAEARREATEANLRRAPLLAAAIMALAFVLVGLRFWAENFEAPVYGLGGVAVNPRGEPAVVLNDELVLHERSGLDIEHIPLLEFGVEGAADIRFFSNGDLLVLEQPHRSSAPSWLQSILGIAAQEYGRLLRCSLADRRCTLLRDEIEEAAILVEPHTDNILLADTGRNRLEKLSPGGERLAVKAMGLEPPVGLARKEGILFLTRGDLNTVSVLKPDTNDFAEELAVIGLNLEGANESGLIFPTALAHLRDQWWIVLQSRDATMAGLFRFNGDWQALARVDLPGGAEPTQLVPWAGKLLVPDAENEMVYRIAGDGQVEAPFNEDALTEALAQRRGEIARTGTLQVLALLILFLGAAGLFALGTVQSLQSRLYRPASDIDEAGFDISNEEIEWLDPAGNVEARLRKLGYAIAGTSAVLLIGAFIAQFSAPALLAVFMVLVGLGGYYLALQRSSGCHLGLLDDQLILVDHNNTYRVGRGSKIQYFNNFVMIDDVIVYLGTRLLPQFAVEQLHRQFEPVVIRGIRVDRTTLRLKMFNGRHPMLFGTGGLLACGCCALLLLLLA